MPQGPIAAAPGIVEGERAYTCCRIAQVETDPVSAVGGRVARLQGEPDLFTAAVKQKLHPVTRFLFQEAGCIEGVIDPFSLYLEDAIPDLYPRIPRRREAFAVDIKVIKSDNVDALGTQLDPDGVSAGDEPYLRQDIHRDLPQRDPSKEGELQPHLP